MAKVAIVGSGLIGRAWTISFARAGHQVFLYDAVEGAPEAAITYIESVLEDLAAYDLLGGASPEELRAAIRPVGTLADAVAGAVHVQENTPEDLQGKRQVFTELDRLADFQTVLASSTSALLPSKFTEHLTGRGRCLVAHPINPPYLVPAVEIVPAPWTDPDVVARSVALFTEAGQAPLVMKREIDGFIMNRMQGALLEEAFRLVADGYASVEDVDIGIREGLALRWSFMGPFETIDLNAPGGLRDYVERYDGLYGGLFQSMQRRVDWTGPVLDTVEAERRQKLSIEELAARQTWRDRRLMALAAHKRQADSEIGE
jgi:L-gulonate 3-dehydrogenase